MRPEQYSAETLVQLFHSHGVCTMEEMKKALGTDVDLTVLRKLKGLSYLTSYSHRGKYYALPERARFNEQGLWFHNPAHFSRYGTLLDSVEHFVTTSEAGCRASELESLLGVDVKESLLKLYRDKRIDREAIGSVYVYTSKEANDRREQHRHRKDREAASLVPVLSEGILSVEEIKAAIVLFSSLLNEKQRRWYAGLEAVKLGHGGDRRLSDLLGIDAQTVARGRRELMTGDVERGRIRAVGGGRKPVEKKRL